MFKEYDKAWLDFTLAFQELKSSLRMFLEEQVSVKYWQCVQDPVNHVFDYDDPRVGTVATNWRTHGKTRCPQCAEVLEEREAKVKQR